MLALGNDLGNDKNCYPTNIRSSLARMPDNNKEFKKRIQLTRSAAEVVKVTALFALAACAGEGRRADVMCWAWQPEIAAMYDHVRGSTRAEKFDFLRRAL